MSASKLTCVTSALQALSVPTLILATSNPDKFSTLVVSA